MSGINFITQTIQDYYDNSTAAQGFRADGTDAEDATIKSLDARISAFEQVIFDKTLPSGVTDDVFPYNQAGLKREFLDEVLAMLLMRTTGTTYARSVTITVYKNSDNSVVTAAATTSLMTNGLLRDTDFVFDLDANNHDKYFTYQYNGESVVRVEGNAAPTFLLKGVRNFDDLTRDQKRDLLNPSGKAIFDYYEKLIDDVFTAGRALETVKDAHTGVTLDHNAAPVVTAITPMTVQHTRADGTTYSVTYDHVTTFKQLKVPAPTDPKEDKFSYIINLVEQGLETYSLRKIPIVTADPAGAATGGATVGFELGFDDATTKDTRYLPVTLVNGVYIPAKKADGVTPIEPVTLKLRNMYIDDYLYFWNEARTRILRASLAYKEAVTKEMQEDLRQANEILAELERLAAGAKTPGGTTGADTVLESTLMDLWEAKVGGGSQFPKIFSTVGTNNVPDDSHTFADWQENRSNLKNYIDRKSAQSQQAMLDYQTILNRYNNAFEIMSKLQEKIDSLLKGQLRNYN